LRSESGACGGRAKRSKLQNIAAGSVACPPPYARRYVATLAVPYLFSATYACPNRIWTHVRAEYCGGAQNHAERDAFCCRECWRHLAPLPAHIRTHRSHDPAPRTTPHSCDTYNRSCVVVFTRWYLLECDECAGFGAGQSRDRDAGILIDERVVSWLRPECVILLPFYSLNTS
jgi:hypothetical protein